MSDIACTFCLTPLHQANDGTWVDDTEGDGCWGDDYGRNENESHVPDDPDAAREAGFNIP